MGLLFTLPFLTFPFPDIEDCASSPCVNGGSCEDRVNEYTCNCPVSPQGPCCVTGIEGYSCSCGQIFYENRCQGISEGERAFLGISASPLLSYVHFE